MGEAILREDREALVSLRAPSVAHAELEAIAGNLPQALSWARRQNHSPNEGNPLGASARTLELWLVRRMRHRSVPGLPVWAHDLEEGITLINKGLALDAFARLQRVLPEAHSLGFQVWDRALSGWVFCLMHLGHFGEARACAQWQLRHIASTASPLIRAACLRRLAAIAFFERDLGKAYDYLQLVELNAPARSRSRLLAMHMRLETALEQGHGYSAQGILETLARIRSQLDLRPEELEPHEIDALHSFSAGRFEKAQRHAEHWLKQSQDHGDRVGEVQALSLLGLALANGGPAHAPRSFATLDAALDLARQEGLAALRLRTLIRAATAATLLHAPERRELWLVEGLKLARQLGCGRWREGFQDLSRLTSPLSTIRERVEAWLRLRGLDLGFTRELDLVEDAIGFHPQGWHHAAGAGLALWPDHVVVFVPQCHLAAHRRLTKHALSVTIRAFDPNSTKGKVALAFLSLKSGEGLTLRSLHALVSQTSFRSERHEGRLRVVVTQTRQLLKPLGIEILWRRDTGHFERTGNAVRELRIAEDRTSVPGRPSTRPARAGEILAFLQQKGFATTSELAGAFHLTRQGLHPIISLMVCEGLVQRVRQGRKSGVALVR